jgi:hypothetical protein
MIHKKTKIISDLIFRLTRKKRVGALSTALQQDALMAATRNPLCRQPTRGNSEMSKLLMAMIAGVFALTTYAQTPAAAAPAAAPAPAASAAVSKDSATSHKSTKHTKKKSSKKKHTTASGEQAPAK